MSWPKCNVLVWRTCNLADRSSRLLWTPVKWSESPNGQSQKTPGPAFLGKGSFAKIVLHPDQLASENLKWGGLCHIPGVAVQWISVFRVKTFLSSRLMPARGLFLQLLLQHVDLSYPMVVQEKMVRYHSVYLVWGWRLLSRGTLQAGTRDIRQLVPSSMSLLLGD